MSKRRAEPAETEVEPLKSGNRPVKFEQDEIGEFEDEYEDEYESEDEIFEAGVDGRPDEEREAEEREDAMEVDQETFMPGRNKLSAGETLAPDFTAYQMLHALESPWPCLSCDIVGDQLGSDRKSYPATVYAVAGTQAARGREKENQLMVLKLSSLSRMQREQEDDSDDDSDDDSSDPILETKSIPLNTCTNRIRSHQSPQSTSAAPPTTLTASMTESGQVLIHDITPHLSAFDTPGATITPAQNKPIHTITVHKGIEGYAVDWSPKIPEGKLVTGDCNGRIFVTTRTQGGGFVTDAKPFTGHDNNSAVEELQWSPSENHVFASAGDDGTVRIWDARSKSRKPAVSMKVSDVDVNVLSWSHQTSHLLASGADDGQWAVWDLRSWKPSTKSSDLTRPTPVASFNFHKEQITSVEWHPTEDSIVLVCAGDNTVTLWDLAVELDDEESRDTAGVQDVPPQLLFVHYMEQVKEAHWHPQIPGTVMATGGSGFGVFKTISV
ncbi:glutamate-rich WD repeat-containing protein 1 [Mytilinidion resinicola]|uniref:Glutamate-rich WD repeat-containing protein 1 n=1 Tax=Mytilinidion resinicola TaxID=574789 RepID=A0A6A6YDY5_9PEZI|nr:glutamate-rich WD repeat-containing protein 1 [Mytilinidion resinicola]KAF2806295.1 glutamate-rich WD repeat-containing protein 1 [Mytilinidion resinicola]